AVAPVRRVVHRPLAGAPLAHVVQVVARGHAVEERLGAVPVVRAVVPRTATVVHPVLSPRAAVVAAVPAHEPRPHGVAPLGRLPEAAQPVVVSPVVSSHPRLLASGSRWSGDGASRVPTGLEIRA